MVRSKTPRSRSGTEQSGGSAGARTWRRLKQLRPVRWTAPWVTPGLIDCHTHLIFAGDRASEWARRLAGESYEDIAKAGGGILSTVGATRAAGIDALVVSAEARLARMAAQGVTTVEVKSGYGLDVENELKMLHAAGRLGERSGVRIVRTLLAAHAVPAEFQNDRKAYLRIVCEDLIPGPHARILPMRSTPSASTLPFHPPRSRWSLARLRRTDFA